MELDNEVVERGARLVRWPYERSMRSMSCTLSLGTGSWRYQPCGSSLVTESFDRFADGFEELVEWILPSNPTLTSEKCDSQLSAGSIHLGRNVHDAVVSNVQLSHSGVSIRQKSLEDFEGQGDILPKYSSVPSGLNTTAIPSGDTNLSPPLRLLALFS